MTRKRATRAVGVGIAEKAMSRTVQTYCDCGEPKKSNSKYCVECKDDRIHFNTMASREREKQRLRAARAARETR